MSTASDLPRSSFDSSKSDAVMVATDKKYGNKQVVSITPRLYDYILTNVREPEVKDYQLFILSFVLVIPCFLPNIEKLMYQVKCACYFASDFAWT